MTKPDILSEWALRTCAIATMHGKERVIAPLIEEAFGMRAIVPDGFNTDQFGTFTRDIARAGNQIEAAEKKARAALAHTGADMVIASEGSFAAHPEIPFVQSNLEVVLLIDAKRNIQVRGHHRTTQVRPQGASVQSVEEAIRTAVAWGFPEQGVIVRRSEHSAREMHKDVTTIKELHSVAEKFFSRPFVRSIYLETDMRAHRCPPRMDSIRAATLDLIRNCMSTCPLCGTPGFVIQQIERGLPCAQCLLPTDLPREHIYQCGPCGHREQKSASHAATADPGLCARCNP